jgi:hypothetical protein
MVRQLLEGFKKMGLEVEEAVGKIASATNRESPLATILTKSKQRTWLWNAVC